MDDFASIAEQCGGRVNQFALGGRGDPDQHEHVEEILKLCREHGIVPNFTKSGYGLSTDHVRMCKEYCGAVAVSWYRNDYTIRAIEMLVKAGVKTNIHYVVSGNTIDEIVARLRTDDFPRGVNGVVLLLHKPVGHGAKKQVPAATDPRIAELFALIDQGGHCFKVGMDACSASGIVNFCHNVIPEALEPCEGARFSCYISPDMVLMPCSFDQRNQYGVSLRDCTIEQAWNSTQFDAFRSALDSRCPACAKRANCMGGCPLLPEITLCHAPTRII